MEHQKHHKPEFEDQFKEHLGEAAHTFNEAIHTDNVDLRKELKNAIEVIKLNPQKIHAVSIHKKSSLPALLFIIVGLLALHLGSYLVYFRFGMLQAGFGSLILIILFSFVGLIVSIFIYDLLGSYLFKGKGEFGGLFRAMGYGFLVMILGIIPVLTFVASIWYLIITYKAIKTVKKISGTNAVLTILLGIVIVAVIQFTISLVIGINLSYSKMIF